MAERILKEAVLLINSGKLNESLSIIEEALKVNPYYAYGWNLKGRVLDALNDNSGAQECYQVAKKYGIDALIMLAGRDHVSRTPKDVNQEMIRPLSYFPDEESWTAQAVSLQSLYKLEEALICYDKALEINPQYIPALENKELLLKITGW